MSQEKQNWFIKHKVLLIIGIIVFVVIIGISISQVNTEDTDNSNDNTSINKATDSDEETDTVTLKYTFDVPSLLGKNIDEIRVELGTPTDGDLMEPTAEQMAGTSQWDNTFQKDGKELLVTFDAKTREVIDFFIPTDDPSGVTKDIQPLLEIGNLNENSSNYTIEKVSAIKDPSSYTGIMVSQK